MISPNCLLVLIAMCLPCMLVTSARAKVLSISTQTKYSRDTHNKRPRRLQDIPSIPETVDVNFNMFTNSTTDITSALDTVQNQASASLSNLSSNYADKLTIDNLTSSLLGGCDGAASSGAGDGVCNQVLTQIQANTIPGLDPGLVENVMSNYMQTFIDIFNQQFGGSILLGFTGPVFVATSVRVTFVGAPGNMTQSEQDLVISTFNSQFPPILVSANPPLNVTSSKVILQLWSRVNNTVTQSIQTYNDVEYYVSAKCSSSNCTDDYLTEVLISQGNAYAASWLSLLRSKGTQVGSTFFDPVTLIIVDDDVLGASDGYRAGSLALVPLNSNAPPPRWLWITIVIDALLLILAAFVAFYLVTRRRKAMVAADRQLIENKRYPASVPPLNNNVQEGGEDA